MHEVFNRKMTKPTLEAFTEVWQVWNDITHCKWPSQWMRKFEVKECCQLLFEEKECSQFVGNDLCSSVDFGFFFLAS